MILERYRKWKQLMEANTMTSIRFVGMSSFTTGTQEKELNKLTYPGPVPCQKCKQGKYLHNFDFIDDKESETEINILFQDFEGKQESFRFNGICTECERDV